MTPAEPIQQLVHQLARLPGIGRKSATRLAYYILRQKNGYAERLAHAIEQARQRVGLCSLCGNLSELDPCKICNDTRREVGLLCVVEQIQDMLAVEASGEFRGRYHILQGAISPLNGIGPEDLRIAELLERCSQESFREIIMALNTSVDGEATSLYLQRMLKPTGIHLTRLATGISVGSDLEYSDRETIARALKGRQALEQ